MEACALGVTHPLTVVFMLLHSPTCPLTSISRSSSSYEAMAQPPQYSGASHSHSTDESVREITWGKSGGSAQLWGKGVGSARCGKGVGSAPLWKGGSTGALRCGKGVALDGRESAREITLSWRGAVGLGKQWIDATVE